MRDNTKSSRQRLDLSSASSPHAPSSPFGSPHLKAAGEKHKSNAIKLQNDIKEKLDYIITGGDNIEIERLGSDLMKIINSALERAPLSSLATKMEKIGKSSAFNSGTGTGHSSPQARMARRISRGVMRNPAADDRSIAENHSHIQLRESNRILENVLSALPVYEKEDINDPAVNLKIKKARALIPVKPQPEVIQEDIPLPPLSILSLFFSIPGDAMYTRCLGFSDEDFMTKQIKLDYFAFKASDLNFPMVIFIFIFGLFLLLLRFNYAQGWRVGQNSMYVAALVTSILAGVCMVAIVFNRLTLLSYKYNVKCLQQLHRPMIQLMKTQYGQVADDGVLLFCAISGALYLLAAVLMPDKCVNTLVDPDHKGNDIILSDSYSYSHTYSYPHSYSHSYSHTYSYPHSHSYAHCDTAVCPYSS
jgi:hypothetical protein